MVPFKMCTCDLQSTGTLSHMVSTDGEYGW